MQKLYQWAAGSTIAWDITADSSYVLPRAAHQEWKKN
jgi:hypothetical protein